ncbi:hypothetical protein CERSUDRAFT_117942 [Gelatoporia subvermispora B]|uniref:F-box domain-containing protein n=1 Tax=Ceriporiopsis subvermispora (strain B) TaxID=914234 RepID=M2R330_CERS8|nr:hypothetical protein CERSUDRAFT_117942 [Gelatoporia subvermispora B]
MSMQFIDTKRPVRLPIEIVETIIENAWCDTIRTQDYFWGLSFDEKTRWSEMCRRMSRAVAKISKKRWKLHRTFSLVCHQWRKVMLRTSSRHIIIESRIDLEQYRATTAIRQNRERPFFHLVASLGFQDFDSHSYSTSYYWEEVFKLILPIVQNCASSRITFTHYVDAFYEFLDPVFALLKQLPHMRTLYLDWSQLFSRNMMFRLPIPWTLPHITYLRLSHYPPCAGIGQCSGALHAEACVSRYLLCGFPHLTHLHLETPIFLKFLRVPVSLEVLILDIPPSPPFTSMLNWNIGAALNRGFFKRVSEGHRRSIVVLTGLEEPSGWLQVQQVCAAHGILLRRNNVYGIN